MPWGRNCTKESREIEYISSVSLKRQCLDKTPWENKDQNLLSSGPYCFPMGTPSLVVVFILQQCMRSEKQSPSPSLDCRAPILKTPLLLHQDLGVQLKEMNKQRTKERRGDGPSLYKREGEMGKNKMIKTFWFCMTYGGRSLTLLPVTVTVGRAKAMSTGCAEELPCNQENSPEKDPGSSGSGIM